MIAELLLSSVVALVLANLLANAYLQIVDDEGVMPDTNPWVAHHGLGKLWPFFPERRLGEINSFINETWVVEQEFAPFYQVRSRETSGRYLNVHPVGFRKIGPRQAPWPPTSQRTTVFLFGGSTAFGSGVEDKHTIAAFLQNRLGERVAVFNFGTGAHFSTQERLMFDHLLMDGYRPDIAVFLDGLNDSNFWNGVPVNTEIHARAVRIVQDEAWRHDAGFHLVKVAKALPLGRLAARFWQINEKPVFWRAFVSDEEARDPTVIKGVISRWLENRRRTIALAELHDVKTLFIWQPIPLYKYSGGKKIIAAFGEAIGQHARGRYLYPKMRDRFGGENSAWCADIQEGLDDILYVDHVHYNPRLSDMVAACIEEHVRPLID